MTVCEEHRRSRYRIVDFQTLDKRPVMLYSALAGSQLTTEAYRLWYRIEHYAPTEESHENVTTAGVRHGSLDDRRSSRGLQCQCADDLPGDQKREAQSLSAQQRLSGQARRFASVVRGLGRDQARQGRDRCLGIPNVYLVCSHTHNSASPDPGRYIVADAAMDLPCHKYTLLPPRKQRRWTVRPFETPGLPSWAGGSGSGSVPLPSATSCILRPLTSVSGCFSARQRGCWLSGSTGATQDVIPSSVLGREAPNVLVVDCGGSFR